MYRYSFRKYDGMEELLGEASIKNYNLKTWLARLYNEKVLELFN